jgi:hypothetical protein
MEVGASVIAFITIAVQSAKTITNVITGIRDAPENVRRAEKTVAMLEETLKQLGQCHAVIEATPAQDIGARIKDCSDDMAAYVSLLRKLQLLHTDSPSRRAWKRFRTVFNEKDLDRMTTVVGTHASTLGLWLASQERSECPHFDLQHKTENKIS